LLSARIRLLHGGGVAGLVSARFLSRSDVAAEMAAGWIANFRMAKLWGISVKFIGVAVGRYDGGDSTPAWRG